MHFSRFALPLNFVLRYSRSKKLKIYLVFYSLNRTFVPMNKILIGMMMLCSLLLTGCDKLDDSDDGMVSEILPGKWAFSYVIKAEEDPGLEFNYKQVIFNEDGTCALTYDEEISYKDDEGKWHTEIVEKALHGTYVANNSVIRIVSDEFDGKERVLLWAIDSLSTKQIVVEYNFSMNGGNLLAIVTLDRI